MDCVTACHSSAILNRQVQVQPKFPTQDRLFAEILSVLYCCGDKLPQIQWLEITPICQLPVLQVSWAEPLPAALGKNLYSSLFRLLVKIGFLWLWD